jgi:hypothetical protein
MKIEINRNSVEEYDSHYKEVTVYGERKLFGTIPESYTRKFIAGESTIDIISEYLKITDGSVAHIVITYKPEVAETINGVSIFYRSGIDWGADLTFNIFEGDNFMVCILVPGVSSLCLLTTLATMEGATRIEVEE